LPKVKEEDSEDDWEDRGQDKVKIRYEPWREIIIKECVYFQNASDLAEIIAGLRAQGVPGSLNWANGVVFFYTDLHPDTNSIANDMKDGKSYWLNVSFAFMNPYKPLISTRANIPIPVINQSSNNTMKDVTEWLKKQSSISKRNV